MKCSDCQHWLRLRVTDYDDGTRITNFEAPPGKGNCENLKILTEAEFGCNRFAEGHDHVEVMARKTGSPWHHSHYEDCPDCKGRGMVDTSVCGRCCGTGHVLFYDDGYVGEERTRRHPNEATVGPPPKPVCAGCGAANEPQWVACPHCGTKLPGADQEKPTRISEFTTS